MEDKQHIIVMILVYIAFIILFESFAQHSFTLFHNEEVIYKYLLAIIFYGFVGFFLMKAYEYGSIGMINILWSSLSVLSVMLIGYFFWGESVTYNDIVGSIIVIIGLYIIMIGDSAFRITDHAK